MENDGAVGIGSRHACLLGKKCPGLVLSEIDLRKGNALPGPLRNARIDVREEVKACLFRRVGNRHAPRRHAKDMRAMSKRLEMLVDFPSLEWIRVPMRYLAAKGPAYIGVRSHEIHPSREPKIVDRNGILSEEDHPLAGGSVHCEISSSSVLEVRGFDRGESDSGVRLQDVDRSVTRARIDCQDLERPVEPLLNNRLKAFLQPAAAVLRQEGYRDFQWNTSGGMRAGLARRADGTMAERM